MMQYHRVSPVGYRFSVVPYPYPPAADDCGRRRDGVRSGDGRLLRCLTKLATSSMVLKRRSR